MYRIVLIFILCCVLKLKFSWFLNILDTLIICTKLIQNNKYLYSILFVLNLHSILSSFYLYAHDSIFSLIFSLDLKIKKK